MTTRRLRTALAAGTLVLLPAPAPPPRPIPDWITGPYACGGVKMGPVPAPGLSVNPEPAHAPGDWYPDGWGSVNPCARHNFVLRVVRGHYQVWFPLATPVDRVVIVPGSTDMAVCTVVSVTPSPPLQPGTDVRVACSSSTGAPADSRFTVRF